MQQMLCDAQTSGGLLAAIPSHLADAVLKDLQASPHIEAAAIIGHFTQPANTPEEVRITVVPK